MLTGTSSSAVVGSASPKYGGRKNARAPVEHGLDQALGGVELETRHERRREREVRMREGVVADLVSLVRDAAREVDVASPRSRRSRRTSRARCAHAACRGSTASTSASGPSSNVSATRPGWLPVRATI